jgi:hypothetical protein
MISFTYIIDIYIDSTLWNLYILDSISFHILFVPEAILYTSVSSLYFISISYKLVTYNILYIIRQRDAHFLVRKYSLIILFIHFLSLSLI